MATTTYSMYSIKDSKFRCNQVICFSKNKGGSIIKTLRRGIIIICGIMTLIWLIHNLPGNNYGFGVTQKDINDIAVTQITVNQKAKIDNRTIIVRKISIDKDRDIHIQVRSVLFPPGWSFRWNVFRLYDDKGREYKPDGSYGSGKIWGKDAVINYEGPLKQDAKELILEYNQYNRHIKFVIPIEEEGGQSE